MTRNELLSIIDFLQTLRGDLSHLGPRRVSEPDWDIALHLVQQHLRGRWVTITSLCAAAEAPYATARRRVQEMMKEKLILQRPRTLTGKTYTLHPSARLIAECEALGQSVKGLIGNTFGLDSARGRRSEFVFGGAYLGPRLLPSPAALPARRKSTRPLRILGQRNPTFEAYQRDARYFAQLIGCDIDVELRAIDEIEAAVFRNAERATSVYDLVAVDLPWLGQIAQHKVLRPLDDFIAADNKATGDYIASTWDTGAFDGAQYAVPLQTTVELLFCVKDQFEGKAMAAPRTTTELLRAARAFHRPARGRFGIMWLGAEGTALGHTFIQRMASFGRPVLDLDRAGDDFISPRETGERHRPVINSAHGRHTAEFLKELLAVSHPDVLAFDWHNSAPVFKQARTAMMLGWTVFICDTDRDHPLVDNLIYAVPPKGPNGKAVSTIGGWNIGIPANVPPRRAAQVWRYTRWLTSPEVMKAVVMSGSFNSPRISVSADPDVRASHPILDVISDLARDGMIQSWPRPPVPAFSTLTSMIGSVMHEMLRGERSVRSALVEAQNQADRILGFA